MARSRRDQWDDWDDEPVVAPERPGLLTTRRILIGLAIVAGAAILLGSVLLPDPMELDRVPESLLGTWTSEHPEHSDRWVQFTPETIVFGTGGTGNLKCRVLGVDVDQVGDLRQVTVLYRDMAGRKHYTDIVLNQSSSTLRFTDSPDLPYVRYD